MIQMRDRQNHALATDSALSIVRDAAAFATVPCSLENLLAQG
jgi:hypothetical protein